MIVSTVRETRGTSPRTVATLNDYDVRVVKTHGEFTRHSHPDTDELFLVLAGEVPRVSRTVDTIFPLR